MNLPKLHFQTHHTRKLRRVNNGKTRARVDLSLPHEVLDAAGLAAGDTVDIHVTPSGRILIAPMRAWPRICGGLEGRCERWKGHPDECIPIDEIPF